MFLLALLIPLTTLCMYPLLVAFLSLKAYSLEAPQKQQPNIHPTPNGNEFFADMDINQAWGRLFHCWLRRYY